MPGVGGRNSTPPHCFRDLPSGLVSTRADRPSGRSMCVPRGLIVIVHWHPCGKGCEAALVTSPPGEFELRASPMISSTEYSLHCTYQGVLFINQRLVDFFLERTIHLLQSNNSSPMRELDVI